MRKNARLQVLPVVVFSLLAPAVCTVPVYADFGHKVVSFMPSASGNGRAVAFDPASGKIYFTRSDSTDIFQTDANNSAAVLITPTDTNGTPIGVTFGALSWDSQRGLLWAAAYDGNHLGAVGIISPSGLAEYKFTFVPPGGNCFSQTPGAIDGLSYDSSDDTLWISDDAALQIHHVSLDGSLIQSFAVPNNPRSGKQGCNTGIAVDGDYLWLALQSGPDQQPHDIVRVAKGDPTKVLYSFAFGDTDLPVPEGLAIDKVTYPGSVTLWTNEAAANNTLKLWDLGFLSFPIPNRTPSDAKIVSVVDHYMLHTNIYGTNSAVEAFTGEIGYAKCPNRNPDEPAPKLGYPKGDSPNPVTGSCVGGTFSVNGNYVGFGSAGTQFLEYDGHPGFDYRTIDQAGSGQIDVFASASGTARISASGSVCNVSSLSSFGGLVIFLDPPFQDYLLCYLHLLEQIPIPDGAHVNKGRRLGKSNSTSPPDKPIGPHLHFEVRKRVTLGNSTVKYVPVDPYGWQGSGVDPWSSLNPELSSQLNQPLWEVCTDPFKPNNSFDTAFGPLAPGTNYSGKICSSGDKSFFKINVGGPGTITFSLDVPESPLNDYNLEVYDSLQNLVAFSYNLPGLGESVSFSATAGTYYIKVFGVALPAGQLPEGQPNIPTFNTSAPYTLCGTSSNVTVSCPPEKPRVQVTSQ